jgi:hypothetical protein
MAEGIGYVGGSGTGRDYAISTSVGSVSGGAGHGGYGALGGAPVGYSATGGASYGALRVSFRRVVGSIAQLIGE